MKVLPSGVHLGWKEDERISFKIALAKIARWSKTLALMASSNFF
jgi:hypothetical protein